MSIESLNRDCPLCGGIMQHASIAGFEGEYHSDWYCNVCNKYYSNMTTGSNAGSGVCLKYEPILQFTSQEQLEQILKEWQHKLGLDDWIIKAEICKILSKPEADGQNISDHVNKVALIQLENEKPYIECGDAQVSKAPVEQVLIHELLHCKLGVVWQEDNSIEMATWTLQQHQLIESLSKALIMAKYGLTLEWFKIN
ncbi:MAG: hypothetical protein EOM59_11640 [Clostridia bacterium]|nr:hypothetical protein [Clostridia bacterium]